MHPGDSSEKQQGKVKLRTSGRSPGPHVVRGDISKGRGRPLCQGSAYPKRDTLTRFCDSLSLAIWAPPYRGPEALSGPPYRAPPPQLSTQTCTQPCCTCSAACGPGSLSKPRAPSADPTYLLVASGSRQHAFHVLGPLRARCNDWGHHGSQSGPRHHHWVVCPCR